MNDWTRCPQPIIKSADMSEEVSFSRIRPCKASRRTSDDAGRLADPSTVCPPLALVPTRRQMQKVAIQVATEAMSAENAEEKDVRIAQAPACVPSNNSRPPAIISARLLAIDCWDLKRRKRSADCGVYQEGL